MKEKIKKLFVYFLIFNSLIVATYTKGTLRISTQIQPNGTTKKYFLKDSLLIDAGILNSQSNNGRIVLGTVSVDMRTEKTNDGEGTNGITGDFSSPFSLASLKALNEIPLTAIKRYKGGNGAKMALKIERLTTSEPTIINTPTAQDNYLFMAYEDEAAVFNGLANAINHLSYTFDLVLEVTNVQSGDIIKSDVKTKDDMGLEAIGSMQDIIKAQFYPNRGI